MSVAPMRPGSALLGPPDVRRWVKGVDGHLYAEVWGHGEALVFVAGLGADLMTFCMQASELSQTHKVVLFDNRGVGRSEKPDVPYTMDAMAGDLLAVLDALDLQRVHLVGASMGGFVAQTFAKLHPDRLSSLALMCTHAGGTHFISPPPENLKPLMSPLPDPADNVRRTLSFLSAPGWAEANAELIAAYARERVAAPTPAFAYQRQLGAAMGFASYGWLPEVRTPTLILHGELDPVVPAANARLLGERIPGAVVNTLQGTGHILFMERAEQVNAQLRDFALAHRAS